MTPWATLLGANGAPYTPGSETQPGTVVRFRDATGVVVGSDACGCLVFTGAGLRRRGYVHVVGGPVACEPSDAGGVGSYT